MILIQDGDSAIQRLDIWIQTTSVASTGSIIDLWQQEYICITKNNTST
ncbi:MAG: hypothetical protein ACR2F1_09345 [Nitrososphaeraceae archaeon]